MARYRRPRALSQRNDPSEKHVNHENNGCTATSTAMALDYHTAGRIQKRGGALRHQLPNPDGARPGATLGLDDAQVMFRKNGQTLLLGQGWAEMKQRHNEGRGLVIQGDSGDLDGSCSESQDVAHAIFVHPDTNLTGDWLVSDPWCLAKAGIGLGKWRWIDRDDIYTYAKALGFRFAYTRRQPRLP